MELTQANYYSLEADRAYMSVSQYKSWCKCPAAELAKQAGEWSPELAEEPIYFTVGKYVDNALTETPEVFEQFKQDNSSLILAKSGKNKDGPKAPFVQADKMIARVRSDPAMMAVLSGETQMILTPIINGVQFKCKLDVVLYPKVQAFTDLKTAKDFGYEWTSKQSLGGKPLNIKVEWYDKYWQQLAVYREALFQKYDVHLLPLIAGVTKQNVPDIDIRTFGNERRLKYELSVGLIMLDHIMKQKNGEIEAERCEHCDYCKKTKILDLDSLPRAKSDI